MQTGCPGLMRRVKERGKRPGTTPTMRVRAANDGVCVCALFQGRSRCRRPDRLSTCSLAAMRRVGSFLFPPECHKGLTLHLAATDVAENG